MLSEQASGTARVTVEDATRLLGIQQASVRKRIKRGTLASEQDAQGKTFVFLEVGELVRDKSNYPRSRPASGRWKLSLENLGAISAVLAAFAAGVYVLGLVVLWAPIARSATHDLTTAWHAASLVPRPVVAGYGLAPLAFPVAISLWFLLGLSTLNVVRFTTNRYLPDHETVALVLQVLVLIMLIVGGIPASLALLTPVGWLEVAVSIGTNSMEFFQSMVRFLPNVLENATAFILFFVVLMSLAILLVVAHGFLLMSTWSALRFSGESLSPRVSNWGIFSRGFVIYFAVMFIPAFLWALTVAQPRLPPVEVTTRGMITESVDTRFNGHPTVEGRLLAHTDSFWYVFDSNDGTMGELMSIPDARVYRIRTTSD